MTTAPPAVGPGSERSPTTVGRRVAYWLVTVVIVAAAVELGAFVFLKLRGDRFLFLDRVSVPTADEIRGARRWFDADLGWVPPYPTPHGERPRQQDRPVTLISTFGNSFTFSDEVEDRDAWAEFLAARIDANVLNFGVAGYGIDQALLRAEKVTLTTPTPLVILGFISENIHRNVSVYRMFYAPNHRLPLTKPRFLLVDGELVLAPNPMRSVDDIARTADLDYLDEVGANDWWYTNHALPILRPPYAAVFLNRSFREQLRRVLAGESVEGYDPVPGNYLWQDPEASKITALILARFERTMRSRGLEPIVLHMPGLRELLQYRRDGVVPGSVRLTRSWCEEGGLRCLFALEALGRHSEDAIYGYFVRGDVARQQGSTRGGHYSPAGNRAIADFLAATLAEDIARLRGGR